MNKYPPAFPVIAENSFSHVDSGMTLRDYFAAKAMQVIVAHPVEKNPADLTTWFGVVDSAACKAYVIADAMLRAREK